MHELSIAQDLIRIIEAERDKHGFGKVNSVRLRAGALSGIEPKALSFAFEVVREGTCATGAVLEMEVEPMKLVCRDCGHIMPGEHGPARCGRCGSLGVKMDAGNYFDIVSLEVD